MDLAAARHPSARPGAAFYESFYLTAYDPQAPRALWIRHTVWQAPGQPPVGSVWRTWFDAGADGPTADKVSTGDLDAGSGLIRVGAARLTADSATAPGWELAWTGDREPFPHLPSSLLYRAPVPRTKSVSLRPRLVFSGEYRGEDAAVDLAGWTGMLGHNWGSEHAERWIWLRGAGSDWLVDLTLGRIRVAGRLLPWVANGLLQRGASRTRLGGLGRRVEVAEREDGCVVVLPGEEMRIELDVPAGSAAGWLYSDPGGGAHHVVHSSVAALDLVIGGVELTCPYGATYELGARERPTTVAMLPFSDP